MSCILVGELWFTLNWCWRLISFIDVWDGSMVTTKGLIEWFRLCYRDSNCRGHSHKGSQEKYKRAHLPKRMEEKMSGK